MQSLKQRYGFDAGRKVKWEDIAPGTMYIFMRQMGSPDVGTVRSVTSDAAMVEEYRPWIPGPSQFPPVRIGRREVASVYAVPDAFAKNLAVMNTTMQFPAGVLGEVMKFKNPKFKGGPTAALEKAVAASPASKEYEQKKEAQRKTDEATRVQKEEDEDEARSREAIAAMKAGRSARRRRRSSTSRRLRRSLPSKSRTTRRLYGR